MANAEKREIDLLYWKVHFQYKSFLFALKQVKVIINKAVGDMTWNKQTNKKNNWINKDKTGWGLGVEIFSLAARQLTEGQMDKSEELIGVNTEQASWANLALRW